MPLGLGMLELLAALLGLSLVGGLTLLVYRFVRAQEVAGPGSAELEALNGRLARLEEQFGGLADSVERVVEGQRFTTTLLAERPPEGR